MTMIESDKEQQIKSLRNGVDAIAEERAVGLLIIIQPDGDDSAVLSAATANMTPYEALEALEKAYNMIRDGISKEDEVH